MTMSAAPARPNARAARTREALMEAGLRLFAERPVDAVPIDDIVAAAGVAKGSFFNHFRDKQHFANTIAADIRRIIELQVDAANAGLADPLLRLAGGMTVAARFALQEPDRTTVMLRGMAWSTGRDNPLNAGLRGDIEAAAANGLLRPEARAAGLLFWLGNCQMLMINIVERRFTVADAAQRLQEVMVMALTGLGVASDRSAEIAVHCHDRIGR